MQPYIAGILIFSISLPAMADPYDPSFFDRRNEGWFFYNEFLPEEEQFVEEVQPEPTPAPIEQELPTIDPVPAPLSAAWFRENLDHYRDIALDNPSKENVARYLQLQRVVMDKASQFSMMAQRVAMSDPLVDENLRRPLMTSASRTMDKMALENKKQVIASLSEDTGIFFFFSSDCPYCVQQSEVLANIERVYGFNVLPVSLDGKALPNGLYTNFKPDQGQGTVLGVERTPSLFMFREPDQFVQLSHGIISMAEFSERVLHMASQAGWIDEDAFDSTRNVKTTFISAEAGSGITQDMLDDPKKLAAFLETQKIRR